MDETDRIREKLSQISVYIKEIEENLPRSLGSYDSASVPIKRTMERDLQLISDEEMDVLALLSRIKNVGIASSEEGLMDKFKEILSNKTLSNLKLLRRLRNVLTHAYKSERYDETVFASAENLSGVREFIKEVEKVLHKS